MPDDLAGPPLPPGLEAVACLRVILTLRDADAARNHARTNDSSLETTDTQSARTNAARPLILFGSGSSRVSIA